MPLWSKKQKAEFETVYSESEFNDRKLILLKAEGPYATVGRPGEATESLVEKLKPNIIIMIDAPLKLEGEDTGDVVQGLVWYDPEHTTPEQKVAAITSSGYGDEASARRHRRHCFRIRFTWIATECRQATVPDRLPSIRSCKREINPFTPIMI